VLSGPPWEYHLGPDIETAKEWNRIVELRKEVKKKRKKKNSVEQRQANYSSNVEPGKTYRLGD
jgi:hypothetical protein